MPGTGIRLGGGVSGTFAGQREWQWQGAAVRQPQAQAGVLAGVAWQPQWQGIAHWAQVQGTAWVWAFMGIPR